MYLFHFIKDIPFISAAKTVYEKYVSLAENSSYKQFQNSPKESK